MFYLGYMMFFISCYSGGTESFLEQTKNEGETFAIDSTQKTYAAFLEGMHRESLKPEDKKKRFFTFINQDVPRYWTNTAWDFNGTSRIPQKGSIACGYFVTNVLADFGISLRRVYLAQQASSVMINELCATNSIQSFRNTEQIINYLQNRAEKEIYIVGLDFHTGFVLRDGNNFYFLHSNYINRQGVVKEKLNESKAFNASNYYYIGSLSANEKLFKN